MFSFTQTYKLRYVKRNDDNKLLNFTLNINGNHEYGFDRIEKLLKNLRNAFDNTLVDYDNDDVYKEKIEAEKEELQRIKLEDKYQQEELKKMQKQKEQLEKCTLRNLKLKQKQDLKQKKEMDKLQKKFE
jgi:septal ring factor EnvC (AmiA/AmiB activator)